MLRIASLVRAARGLGHDRVRTRPWPWQGGHLIALCDGAGGVSGASEAADFVVDSLADPSREPPIASTRAFLVDMIHWIDQSALLASSSGLTTGLVVLAAGGVVQGASVGDSEAWLVSADGCEVLTEGQNRKPLIGSRRCNAVAFGPVPMHGTLIIGSDGLFKYCKRERLLSLARSAELQSIPELLMRATELSSGAIQDDFAVVVCREVSPVPQGGR